MGSHASPKEFRIDPTKIYKPDFMHLGVFMSIMLLSGCAQNYIDYSNAAEALYDVQYHWDKDTAPVHQTWIASSIILGATVGAGVGGKIMQFGRRRAHFILCFSGMIGVGLTMVEDFYV